MPVYAHQAILEAIPDLFCAEALWQAPGFALFSRRPLLRDLLERHPREQRGNAATRCFAHVIVTLPQEAIDDDDHLARGARARELEQALAALHQRDFADLLGGDAVRYQVQGSDDVPPGAVAVRFGHAVYLPAHGEKIAFSASVSRDGTAWKPVCPVYTGQRLALLGVDDAGPHAWAPGPDCAILLLNDGPGAQPVVQVRPRGAYECRFDVAQGTYMIRARHAQAQGSDSVLLRIATVAAAAPAATPEAARGAAAGDAPPHGPAVWQARPAGSHAHAGRSAPQPAWQAAADATALPQAERPALPAGVAEESEATYVPLARQRVTLAALALPRLSRYRDSGARRLDIPLAADHSVMLTVDADDGLHTQAAGGRHPVAAPATVPQAGGRAIQLLPPPSAMADRYCALLPLPQAASVQLPLAGRHQFGRQTPALAALRMLDSPRLLHCDGAPSSADRIGLSRLAFSFEMSPQGVRIARLAASQALYHLDGQLQFVAAIGAASAQSPYLLPHGHHVAAGHYVLRFDA